MNGEGTEKKESNNEQISKCEKNGSYGTVTGGISNILNQTKNAVLYENFSEEKIEIPDAENYKFSFRKLWAFSGPGFLMSIAYLDPGNIEADLKAGALARHSLLWILLWATLVGLFVQRLAARVGAVTGEDLAETCRKRFAPLPRYVLWIMLEITIIAADMQEVIGTAIALFLLTNKNLPIYGGVILTILDTFTFLFLDKYGLRKLEAFFAFLITVMAITFGYEYVVTSPPQLEVLQGLAVPGCLSCNSKVLLQAVGIVGALITPHNLYLHSSLVKSRDINRRNRQEVSEANRYFFIESAIALFISLIINIFVVSVFGEGMYGKTEAEALQQCYDAGINASEVFHDDDSLLEGNYYSGGIFLGCQFGQICMYVWAVGLLAAGQSSTMTGTYTGQFVMEGFLHMRWQRWKRVLLTRTLAILPTVFMALFTDVNSFSGVNDFLNALMSMQLPFALMATFLFTSSEQLMGSFVNDRKNKIFMGVVTVFLICLNIYFVSQFVSDNFPHTWWIYLIFGLFLVFYVIVLGYLALCLFVVLGWHQLTRLPKIGPYLEEKYDECDKLLESKETLNS